jgi:hypothetical protein
MRCRWVKRNLSVQLPLVGQSIVAMWWPGRYYWVSTIQLDRDSPLAKLTQSLKEGTHSDAPPPTFVTQVFKCDAHGFVKSLWDLSLGDPEPLYEQTYDDLAAAKLGHEETARLIELGRIRQLKYRRWIDRG